MVIMARRITTLLIDDLDGESEAAETLAFGLDGALYEIDLTEQHAQDLRDSVATFVDAARQVGGKRSRATAPASARPQGPAATKPSASTPDMASVRAWAREHDIQVSDRGRVAGKVFQAYRDAH